MQANKIDKDLLLANWRKRDALIKKYNRSGAVCHDFCRNAKPGILGKLLESWRDRAYGMGRMR